MPTLVDWDLESLKDQMTEDTEMEKIERDYQVWWSSLTPAEQSEAEEAAKHQTAIGWNDLF